MPEKMHRLARKLKDKDFKLTSLLEITKAINSNVDTEELLALYQSVLQDSLDIEKLILFANEDSWRCILKYGVEGEVPDIPDETFFMQSSSFNLDMKGASEKENFDIVIPVHQDDEPLAYLLVGDIDETKQRVSPVISHMKFIQTLTNIIIVAIQNKHLMLEQLEQERMNRELELAAEMQALLVPNRMPQNDRFEIATVYKPHQQVGGDYYDFFQPADNEVVMCMADVSGKGVSAAFLMANFQAYLRALFTYKDMDLEAVIRELNSQVMNSAQGEKYITFFIARADVEAQTLQYINCGHNPPVLCRANGDCELLSLGSIGLGMFEEIPKVSKGEVQLSDKDVLVCYTDGLVELENEAKEEFGVDRLEKLVHKNFSASMNDLNGMIMTELESYRGSMPYIDDTALLSCRFQK